MHCSLIKWHILLILGHFWIDWPLIYSDQAVPSQIVPFGLLQDPMRRKWDNFTNTPWVLWTRTTDAPWYHPNLLISVSFFIEMNIVDTLNHPDMHPSSANVHIILWVIMLAEYCSHWHWSIQISVRSTSRSFVAALPPTSRRPQPATLTCSP